MIGLSLIALAERVSSDRASEGLQDVCKEALSSLIGPPYERRKDCWRPMIPCTECPLLSDCFPGRAIPPDKTIPGPMLPDPEH